MTYNINYCIISVAYLSITAFFYRRQVRIRSRRSALFSAMLQCGILSLVLDIIAAVIDPYAHLLPAWPVYIVNITFLLTAQTTGVLFFYYAIHLTGTYARMRRWMRVASILPFLAAALLILVSPFSHAGVFYLDESHVYCHGITHTALYAATGLYLLSGLVIVLVRRRRLHRHKFYTVLAFLATSIAAMLIQMNHPYLLVNSTANAFALMLMYHILEAPGAHMDALTNVMNHSALLPMLRNLYEERERGSLIVYSLNSLHIVNHSFGMKGGDEALVAFAKYLQETFPKRSVFRIEGDVFGVLQTGGEYIDRKSLMLLRKDTPEAFSISVGEIILDTSLACLNSEDCESAQEMLSLLESLMRQHRSGGLGPMLLADAEYKMQLQKTEAIERATKRALDEGRVDVYYQPIHDADGQLCALEALVRVTDPQLGPLPTQELVELAEHNGSILRLGEQVLEKTCAFIRDHDLASWGLDHVGVNLSAVQCVQNDLPERVDAILTAYGVPEGLVAFEITETAAGALTALRKTMERLKDRNISFLLDDFGTGYANYRNMTALPYHCIKLDKSLLWSAKESESRMKMLRGVVKVVRALGLSCLCEGVETQEHAALLISLGVSMLQGYYFSKPLSPEALLRYAGKADEP